MYIYIHMFLQNIYVLPRNLMPFTPCIDRCFRCGSQPPWVSCFKQTWFTLGSWCTKKTHRPCAGNGSDRFHRCQCITGKHRSAAELPLVRRVVEINSLFRSGLDNGVYPQKITKWHLSKEHGDYHPGDFEAPYFKGLKLMGWHWLIDGWFSLGYINSKEARLSIYLSICLPIYPASSLSCYLVFTGFYLFLSIVIKF